MGHGIDKSVLALGEQDAVVVGEVRAEMWAGESTTQRRYLKTQVEIPLPRKQMSIEKREAQILLHERRYQ